MSTRVILSVIGSDRPGLTRALADAVHGAGGNWLESHLARLGGKYVGAVLVELEADRLAALEDGVRAVDAAGLHVSLVAADAEGEAAPAALQVDLLGQDRPGIVREVTTVLAGLGVNIATLETSTESGAWSGERLFRARLLTHLPPGVDQGTVRESLEALSGELMVDIAIGPVPAAR